MPYYEPLTEIDLRNRMWGEKHYSRLVWQVLFREYREGGGNLDDMDSLLCDLYTLEREFHESNGKGFELAWAFRSGWTETRASGLQIGESQWIEVMYSPEDRKIYFHRVTLSNDHCGIASEP